MGYPEIIVTVPVVLASSFSLIPSPSSWKIFLRPWAPEASSLESEERATSTQSTSDLNKPQTVSPWHIHPKTHPAVSAPPPQYTLKKHSPEVAVPVPSQNINPKIKIKINAPKQLFLFQPST